MLPARSPPQIKQAFALISSNKVAQDFVDAMGWEQADRTELDTTGWTFTGGTREEVRAALLALLEREEVGLQDVFQAIDLTDDLTLNLDEFVNDAPSLGGPRPRRENV